MIRAKLTGHFAFKIGRIDPRLFGAFVEHVGRSVYGGLYDPGHSKSDASGFRRDVLEDVCALAPKVVRYPGGNFVSGYDWRDGVGDAENRPVRLDLAWHSTETNAFGTNEFLTWCGMAGVDPILAVNMGTGTLDDALAYLEYVNHPTRSSLADQRRAHGYPAPWGVKHWCLGNELDGPWQIGCQSPQEYASRVLTWARAMRRFEPDIVLIACGSSEPFMETFPAWEYAVLSEAYDEIDFISLHMYFEKGKDDTTTYLGRAEEMSAYVVTIAGAIDLVRAQKRSERQVHIAFDEWNAWYHSRADDRAILDGSDWPVAPPLLEDRFTVEDALMVACALNTLITHADRVRIGCLAQLVNAIAPIVTEPGGGSWRQTIFHPVQLTARYASGHALRLTFDGPSYDTSFAKGIPYLSAAATHDDTDGAIAVFLVNRHMSEAIALDLHLDGFCELSLLDHQVLWDTDILARNSSVEPNRVQLRTERDATCDGNLLRVSLPPLSYHMLRLSSTVPSPDSEN